ncbi:MAG: hypothetical protein AAGA92_06875 [Planctomycetota bacterium]
MKLLDRLESLVRRFAVPGLTGKLVTAQVFFAAVFLLRLQQGAADPLEVFWLDFNAVAAGQVWRLVTFLLLPPFEPALNLSAIFLLFYWRLLYTFGTALEYEWGFAKYNLYLIIGSAATVFASAVAWLVWGAAGLGGNGFLYASIFLAFARYYPDYVLHIMLVLPMKVKWLAWFQAAGYVFLLVFGTNLGRLMVLASVTNYLVFFGRDHYRDAKQRKRSQEYRAKAKEASKPLVHECRVCGLTSQMAPKTLFRYCSQCDGQACYCPEHIGNHEHVRTAAPADAEPADAEA